MHDAKVSTLNYKVCLSSLHNNDSYLFVTYCTPFFLLYVSLDASNKI